MSIYSFSDIELQAYKNIWIAIQNYDVHAELPAIDSEKALTLYKKVLSESKSGYMYNQNQIYKHRNFSYSSPCGVTAYDRKDMYLTLSSYRWRWSSQGATRQGGDFPLGKYDPVLD